AFSSCKSPQKRMRNEVGSSPRPTAHPHEDRLPTHLEPWKRLAPARPSQLSDWPTRTPPCGQLYFDLETSPSGMLRSQGRKEGWRHVSTHVLPGYEPLLAPAPHPDYAQVQDAEPSFALPGLWSRPASPHPPDTSRVLPGIQASIPLPSRVPGSRVPS
ncbi:unnamed protein product, partial [Rangifer tarandus platyrhynchus]